MIRAAGLLLLCKAGQGQRVLFLRRGAGSDHPGEWAFPGGQIEGDETAEQAAIRETEEECGAVAYSNPVMLARRIANREIAGAVGQVVNPPLPPGDAIVVPGEQVDYTTFLARTNDCWTPTLNEEHTGFAWVDPTEPPEPLHPGARIALARLTMDELGVARAIAAGDLVSPQRYQNVLLFAIRITGTGAAYRSGLKEYVWRDPSLYLNDEFLARCNGLAVIWVHPAKATLDSQEFADRVIGSVMLPYIQGDEVWAIAKIYDEEAAAEMATVQLSTSPSVVLRNVNDSKIKLEDGSVMLVEGKPMLLDHIAIVPNGVWDKSGDPTGVLTQAIGDARVADETEAERKEREDRARKDADAGEKLDKLLSGLSGLSDGLGALGKRMDTMELQDKARRDAEQGREIADAGRRRDAEREEWMKADAEQCARDDAEEEAERNTLVEKGEPKEVAADRARQDRKARMDKRRADADETQRRADSQAAVDRQVADAITKLNLPKSTNDADHGQFADVQSRADAVYNQLGLQAAPPMQGETVTSYRIRLARGVQRHSKAWAGVDLAPLPTVAASGPSAFDNAETMIYADAALAARNPTDLPEDGGLVTVPLRDPVTGLTRYEFRGRHTFITALKRPSSRVVGVRTGKDS